MADSIDWTTIRNILSKIPRRYLIAAYAILVAMYSLTSTLLYNRLLRSQHNHRSSTPLSLRLALPTFRLGSYPAENSNHFSEIHRALAFQHLETCAPNREPKHSAPSAVDDTYDQRRTARLEVHVHGDRRQREIPE